MDTSICSIYSQFIFEADDNQKIYVHKWAPNKKGGIKDSINQCGSVLHIVHGMGEHARRYSDFAKFLNEYGFCIYAMDQRGHGLTAGSPANFGHQDDNNGWEKVIKDIRKLNEIILKENNNTKLFLFGHSAGSFLVRDYLIYFPDEAKEIIKGIILSGTSASPGLMGYLGIFLANQIIKKSGPKAKSPLHRTLTFGKFNSCFKPNRTTSDWISRDEKAVDKMLDDPYCYTLFSATFYKDLINSTLRINKFKNISLIPKDIPILLISGTDCAVGNFTKGVKKVYKDFIASGIKNVQLKLYNGARHELINEINRDEVFKDIKAWLEKIKLD